MQSLGLGKKWSEICRVFGVSEVGTCWDLERSTVGYLTELTVNMNAQSEYFSLRNAQLLTFYCGIFWWQNCNELPRPVLGWAANAFLPAAKAEGPLIVGSRRLAAGPCCGGERAQTRS